MNHQITDNDNYYNVLLKESELLRMHIKDYFSMIGAPYQ